MNNLKNTLEEGDKIEVYRNLHKKCFSVRHKGKVVGYLQDNESMNLTNAKFVVQPAGRAKVLREKRKNVHAFVRGYYTEIEPTYIQCDAPWIPASYNPYKADTFQVEMDGDMRKIAWNPEVLIQDGRVYV